MDIGTIPGVIFNPNINRENLIVILTVLIGLKAKLFVYLLCI